MLKFPLVFFFVFVAGFYADSQEIEKSLKCSGAISDICLGNDKIYVATENACVDIFSQKDYSLLRKITLPKLVDFFGDSIKPNVYSVDTYTDKILIVSQGTDGFSNVFLTDGNHKSKLIDSKTKHLAVKKAVFVDSVKILMGMLSNEIGLFDIKKQQFDYLTQISPYAFSDFDLSDDNNKVYSSDESGVVHCLNVKDGKINPDFESVNVDNVYQIDFSSNIIVTAGKDRRLGVYEIISKKSFYLESDFLILSLGLSGDGKTVAFMSGENGQFSLLDIESRSILFNGKHGDSPLSAILFFGENRLITANEQSMLTIWKLNK
jgi:WD40 repeat protein